MIVRKINRQIAKAWHEERVELTLLRSDTARWGRIASFVDRQIQAAACSCGETGDEDDCVGCILVHRYTLDEVAFELPDDYCQSYLAIRAGAAAELGIRDPAFEFEKD